MSAFTKKPVTIEAVQFRLGEIPGDTMIHEGIVAGRLVFVEDGTCQIQTTEGTMTARDGDWIIRGIEGEFYPCRDSVFQATYLPASEAVKGLPVSGYRPQNPENIRLANVNKAIEEQVLRVLDGLAGRTDVDKRWLAIGRTHIETGFMGVNRAVFQPGRVSLPGDVPSLNDAMPDTATQDLRSRGEPRVLPAA